jgi:hypothetical protein
MPRAYAGVAKRPGKRPTVPRSVRRANQKHSKEDKENYFAKAEELCARFNRGLTDLSIESGIPRSQIAQATHHHGIVEGTKRDVNSKNAWMSARMAEVNKGKLLYILLFRFLPPLLPAI